MFRRAGCPWCAAWDREIAPIYGKTDAGRRAPVSLADLAQVDEMKLALRRPVRFTPTFVLLELDREIGRIEGYPGENFFWGPAGTAVAGAVRGRRGIIARAHEQRETLREAA